MKIPYSMVAAVDTEIRHRYMLEAIRRKIPHVKDQRIDDARTLHVACYGPSLEDTWRELGRPILSMSGATRWLAERGVVPDYHCDMDPRPHKVKFLDPPVPGVHYLMASVCHPSVWDILQDQRVSMFHVVSSHETTLRFVARHDTGSLVINGGSTIGLTALHLGGVMGYRRFEIHGMDGSFRGSTRHAGPHHGKAYSDDITWDAGRVTYRTNKIMANAVAETLNQIRNFSMLCVFHGSGLTQALVREQGLDNACCADETEKALRIRSAIVNVRVLGTKRKKIPAMSPFDALVKYPPRDWVFDLESAASHAHALRSRARYNTGSLSVAAMLYLRAIIEIVRPTTIVEVGTFIGGSTMAMEHGLRSGGHLYTCDVSNDCLESTDRRTCYPYTTSTAMLADLVAKKVKVDFFFFDGRIQESDLALILRLSRPTTVYAFDDFTGRQKGIANVERLAPLLPNHGLMPQPSGVAPDVTIAILGPR